MRKILTLAPAAMLGLALAAGGCSSASSSATTQTVAYTARIAGHAPGLPQSGGSVVRRASTFEWGDDYWGDFWRDPSNGGLNTNILASTGSTSNAEDWSLQANGTCGGTVTSTCPGGWLSANIRGFAIVTLRNIGQGSLCMGIDAANLWLAKMATCDGVNGQHHYDTLFVYVPGAACGSLRDTAFLSYQWNKNGDPGAGYVIDGSGSNSQVAVLKSADIPHCPESLWNPIAS